VGGPAARAEAITGVCPDGSIYIVRSEAQVPCSRSKRIEPHEVPPLRPEYLPSPYTWHVWQQRENPNNPYNLIDAARQVQGLQAPPPAGGGPGAAGAAGMAGAVATPPVSSPPPGLPAPPPAPRGPLDLGLSDEELRDLFLIVELSQERTPARFRRETADGRGVFEVSLAWSAAFEKRLREAWASRGGLDGRRVLVFTALSKEPESFHANFSFVQGHLTYQPDARDPAQLGVLQGRLGDLEASEAVLGYVVLPDTMSLGESLDVFWNDRRTTVHFADAGARG
jgi:hypothetical protein